MTSITSPVAPSVAEFAAAGVVLTDAEYAAIVAWKPYCSPEGCVCEKYADCDYCEACTGQAAESDAEYLAYLAAEAEAERPFWVFMYGEDDGEDD